MRILQISHNHHIVGGSDAVYFATSDLLRQAGHEVIPFCIANPRNLASEWGGYFPAGVDTGRAPLRGSIRFFFNAEARGNLTRLLDNVGPVDVAHLHIYHGKQTPAILPVLKARGIRIVQSLHEYKLACPVYTLQRNGKPCELCVQGSSLNSIRHRCKDNSALRSFVMAAEQMTSRMLGDVRLVDQFICVSEFQRRIMERTGIPGSKLTTLYNFVDTSAFRADSGHDGYLLYFGRIEELKGVPTLIEAVRRTGQRLLIAGDGAWRSEMLRRIEGLNNVEYLGFQSGPLLQQLIARSRAVIVPSEWNENCPMSVLEAKALGRPIIGARIGGIPELIRDRVDGFLFEPGNCTDLVATLNAMERADHAQLSQNARMDAEARFSRDRHLAALTSLYMPRPVLAAQGELRTA